MGISIRELSKISNPVIIDIRSVEKYNDNHMEGAKNIPMILLLKDPSKYLDRYTNYYIYCQKGENSVRVCQALNRQGYKTYSIIGGYEGWLLEK